MRNTEENGLFKYIYHLSNVLNHNSLFTIEVIEDLLQMVDIINNIIRFKMDNCSAQYKCKYIFALLRDLALNIQKTIIFYYGVKGHGKGLVDAMSGFGIKGSLRNAIITKDRYFNSAEDVHSYLSEINNDQKKKYLCLPQIDHDENRPSLRIPNCKKQHVIMYAPDGSVQTKENLCFCKCCLVGDLVNCETEKRKMFFRYDGESYSDDLDNEAKDNVDDVNDNDDNEYEDNEVPQDLLVEFINIGNIIALYSPSNAKRVVLFM